MSLVWWTVSRVSYYSRMREVISVTDRILKIKFSIVLVWPLFILTLPSKHVKLGHCLAAALVDRSYPVYVLAGFMFQPTILQPWRSTKLAALTNCIAMTNFRLCNHIGPRIRTVHPNLDPNRLTLKNC